MPRGVSGGPARGEGAAERRIGGRAGRAAAPSLHGFARCARRRRVACAAGFARGERQWRIACAQGFRALHTLSTGCLRAGLRLLRMSTADRFWPRRSGIVEHWPGGWWSTPALSKGARVRVLRPCGFSGRGA